MKKILLIIALTIIAMPLILSSCQNGKTKEREKEIADSIYLAKKAKKAEIELLAKKRSKKAWGDIQFGVTTKEFKKKHKDAIINTDRDEYCTFYISDKVRYLPERTRMYATFENDSLRSITITSIPESARYWEVDILRIINSLKDRLTVENGEPTTSNPIPEFYKLKPGVKVVLYVWDIKSKQAEISIKEDYYESTYQVTCEISNYGNLNEEDEEKQDYHPSPLLPPSE